MGGREAFPPLPRPETRNADEVPGVENPGVHLKRKKRNHDAKEEKKEKIH